jgi:integrase
MKRPKYRRHVGRDRGFVEYGGKRHYLPGPWKSPESKAAYLAFIRANNLDILEPPDGKPHYVCQVTAAFVEWANATYQPGVRSEAANCRAAIGHLVRRDGPTLINDYGPLRLKALQLKLASDGKSRSYINAVTSRIKRCFKWAVGEELIAPSIYHALAVVPGLRKGRTQAAEPPKRIPAAWADVSATLPELSPTVKAMVLLQWFTGARSQSVCLARIEQFDRSRKPWEWRPRHKGEHRDQSLVLFVGPQAQKAIAPFFEGRQPADFLFEPKHQNGKRAKGFRSFYDSVSYLRAVSRAIDRVNATRADDRKITRWTPHMLRHARATLVREAHGLEATQAVLGHARMNTTEIYAAKQIELAKRVAKSMG